MEGNHEGDTKTEAGGQERVNGAQDQFRVVINKEAQGSLMALVERANDGFEGGEISKSDLVNWILIHSTRFITEADLKTLRGLAANCTRQIAVRARRPEY